MATTHETHEKGKFRVENKVIKRPLTDKEHLRVLSYKNTCNFAKSNMKGSHTLIIHYLDINETWIMPMSIVKKVGRDCVRNEIDSIDIYYSHMKEFGFLLKS